jgi:predicted MFS family arabinose efflux permease
VGSYPAAAEPVRTAPRRGSRPVSAVAAVVALQAAISLPVFLVSTLAPYLVRDIGLRESTLGLAVGSFYAVSGATAVWLGRIADRQAWQRGLYVAAAAALVPMALLGAVADGAALLTVGLVISAVVQSHGMGTTNLAIVDTVPPQRQGLAFGVKQAAVPAATLLAGVCAPVFAERAGWRWAFAFAAAFPVLAVVLTLWRHRTPARPAAGGERADASVPAAQRRKLRTMAVAFSVATFTTSSLGAFFVLFAVDRGMAPALAGVTVAVASAVNITMRVSMGWLADRRQWRPFVQGGLVLGAGASGYFVLIGASGWLLPVGAVLAFGLGWAWQGLIHLGAVRLLPTAPGYATGVIRTGLAIGSATGPVVSGLVIRYLGYRPLWTILGCLATGAAAAVLLTNRRPLEAR